MGVHAANHTETTSLSMGAEEQPLCSFILLDGHTPSAYKETF